MKRMSILLVSLSLLVSTPAISDENSHRQAVLNLLEVINAKQINEQVLVSISKMIDDQVDTRQLSPEGTEVRERLKKEMLAWISETLTWDKLKNITVDLYLDIFSEEEINELITFYRSPLGRKMLNRMPEVIQKTMQKTQAIVQQSMPEFQRRIQKVIADLKKYERRK